MAKEPKKALRKFDSAIKSSTGYMLQGKRLESKAEWLYDDPSGSKKQVELARKAYRQSNATMDKGLKQLGQARKRMRSFKGK